MFFKDISTDTQEKYQLKENEQCVFFLFNRSGNITFELAGVKAEAHIFACCIGDKKAQSTLHITQHHLAPHTRSSALVKSALSDESTFTYEGLIRIEPSAHGSDASQESRALLLSPDARAFSKPALEILQDDVRCHHAATTSSLDPEQLFFARSRGLSPDQAEHLLVNGFFQDTIEKMNALGVKVEIKSSKIQVPNKLKSQMLK